jgi:hypothetical protein
MPRREHSPMIRRAASAPFSRRKLLRDAVALASAGAAGIGPAIAAAARENAARVKGYGRLLPDPGRRLNLPPGFRYRIISRAGQPMSDGLRVPGLPDGMHAFGDPSGTTRVLRNHELHPGSPETAYAHLAGGPPPAVRRHMYDVAVGRGAVTTLVFDTRTQELRREFLSLAGTLRNCAGGATPWGSWISCEEMPLNKGQGGAMRDHGFNFEVPAAADELVDAVALEAMGRFNHEAVGVDPVTGIVYQTEDRADGLFYRFLPDAPGELHRGGRLQALALRDAPGVFTGNWPRFGRFPAGERLALRWLDMDNVRAPGDDLRLQGRARGAALFARGEGIAVETRGESRRIWFVCTAGGRNKRGQLFCYRPGRGEENAGPGTLELFLEPNDSRLLNHGDNLCVAPYGDIVICEDSKENQRLMGVTPDGGMYEIAQNAAGDSEFAGATFAPDGTTLFVNLQDPGLTFAVTGPWPSRSAATA